MTVIRRRTTWMSVALVAAAALGVVVGANEAHAAFATHYWDMDTVDGSGVPEDVAGGLATSAEDLPNLKLNQSFTEPYVGAGNALITDLGGLTSSHLLADVHDGINATALNFGTDDFSFSYWSYNDNAGDGDGRGPRIFDALATTTIGIQLGSNASGIFNYRMDDDAGGSVLSNTTLAALAQAGDVWTHIAVNVSRSTDTAEVFFGGASQGTYDISGLTGDIFPSQDLDIGTINNGNTAGGAQSAGLDDLAFYSGLLSQQNISDLADGTITPDQVPEPSMLLLLGLGVAGLSVTRGRRAS